MIALNWGFLWVIYIKYSFQGRHYWYILHVVYTFFSNLSISLSSKLLILCLFVIRYLQLLKFFCIKFNVHDAIILLLAIYLILFSKYYDLISTLTQSSVIIIIIIIIVSSFYFFQWCASTCIEKKYKFKKLETTFCWNFAHASFLPMSTKECLGFFDFNFDFLIFHFLFWFFLYKKLLIVMFLFIQHQLYFVMIDCGTLNFSMMARNTST